MAPKNKITRRGFLPIFGGSLFIPFTGFSKDHEESPVEEDFEILIRSDGTPVKVKKSALKQSEVLKKNISNGSLLQWLKKKL